MDKIRKFQFSIRSFFFFVKFDQIDFLSILLITLIDYRSQTVSHIADLRYTVEANWNVNSYHHNNNNNERHRSNVGLC